ncbi:hypothetical protein EBN03_11105 [Nocardia stercoris]|uniref:Lipase n=2 Tax=Nocardia stercoris TaxID=2483361 RepID=A0A3M2L9B4_9NOCA|nr:hypothetical protein EBN03_11105 [Nocardia stercoris]
MSCQLGTAAAEPDSPLAGPAGAQTDSSPTAVPVGVTTLHLVDPNRADARAPQTRRELAVTIHYPAADAASYPLADGSRPWLPVAGHPSRSYLGAPVDTSSGRLPVVLYQPGAGAAAYEGTTMVESLAARGYVVVSMDDTHDALFGTDFPDGHYVPVDPNAELSADTLAISSAARAGDISFVLDQLSALTRGVDPDVDHGVLPAGLDAAMDLNEVGMFGHNLGGAMALYADSRVRAGVDLDGALPPTALDPGLVADPNRPMLFVLGGGTNPALGHDTLQKMTGDRPGWTRELVLDSAVHQSFDDIKYNPDWYQVIEAGGWGALNPDRGHAVINAYVAAMFDHFLRGRHEPLLDAPSAEYPEITFG